MQAYSNSREHIFDELRRLDLLLNIGVARQRRDPAYRSFDEFRGLFISEQEIAQITGQIQDTSEDDTAAEEYTMRQWLETLAHLEQQIAGRTAAALAQGVVLTLAQLANWFQLSAFDIDALLICLAPELDLKYTRLYAYLQNDVTRKHPSADLLIKLLCGSFDEQLRARVRLGPTAPLLQHQLIGYANETQSDQTTFLARPLKIDPRIMDYLLDIDTLDEHLAAYTRLIMPHITLADLLLPEDLKAKVGRLWQIRAGNPASNGTTSPQAFLFHGPAGVGKHAMAEALCQISGTTLLSVDTARLQASSMPPQSLMRRLMREARLRGAAIYFDHAEVLLEDHHQVSSAWFALLHILEQHPGTVFIGSTQPWQIPGDVQPLLVRLDFPAPTYTERQHLWQLCLAQTGQQVDPAVDLDVLADMFHFTAQQIRNAVGEAALLSVMRGQEHTPLVAEDLYQACREQSRTRLTNLARKITPLYTWDDIILPATNLHLLREICSQIKHRQRVFSEWGFSRKLSLGKGLSVLFIGASGTGKTMAAEIIANELALDLYKIDLSGVISKYIGETEKNLNSIFAEAAQSNAILFFDEADAVFGKRSEVKDAHDRYANIEINYLLQKLEEYEGIVILASNFHKNIDEAFMRRMRFVVDFPFPNETYRARIWQSVCPPAMPRSNDIDFDFLAHKFKLPGGSIKNIVLGAAFLAAADGAVVTMEHIIRSIKREFQKTGRVCVKADFDHYFDLVEHEELSG